MSMKKFRMPVLGFLSLLLLLGLGLGTAADVDALKAAYTKNLDEITALQKTGAWSPEHCEKMMVHLMDNQKIAGQLTTEFNFHFDKTGEVIRKQNFLVQNMHDFATTATLRATKGKSCLLVIGKTPLHREFAGLFLGKVSDRDVTYVGAAEAEAKELHLKVARENFKGPFVETTLMEIAQGEETIARTSIQQFDDLAVNAAISPEMHRTYSGMKFVEDYVVTAGEIQTLDEAGNLKIIRMAPETKSAIADQIAHARELGYVVDETKGVISLTKEGFTTINIMKDKSAFIDAANDAFSGSGSTFRFSKEPPKFSLGFVSDIDAQLRLNLDKIPNDIDEELKRAGKSIAPEELPKKRARMIIEKRAEVYKKYGKRYAVALRWACDEAEFKFHEELTRLVHDNPEAVPEFVDRYRKTVVNRVSTAQAREYHKAIKAGNMELAKQIEVDTRGAIHNFRRNITLEPSLKPILGESLGELWRVGPPYVLEGGADNVLFKKLGEPVMDLGDELMAGHSLPHVPLAFSRKTLWEYMKHNPKMTAFQIGSQLFVLYEAYEQYHAAGDPWKELGWLNTLAKGGASFIIYDAIPVYFELTLGEAAAGLYNTVSLGVTISAIAFKVTGDFAYSFIFDKDHILGKKQLIAFGGVTPDGKDTNIPEFFDTLGVPLTKEDLDAPGEVKLGKFDNGKVIRERDSAGNFVFKSLMDEYHAQWDRGDRGELEGFFDERMKWDKSVFSPGQLIVTRRLDRAYDKLRAEYVRWAESKPACWNDYLTSYRDFKGHIFQNTGAALSAAEFYFYDRKFKEAWDQSPARVRGGFSVHAEMDKEIYEGAYQQFHRSMIQHGFENDGARIAFERAGPIELEGWIKAKMPIKFDGHLWTEAELNAELQKRWAPYNEGLETGRRMFIPIVRKRFPPEKPPKAPLGLARARIVKVDIQRGKAPVRTAEGHPNNGAGKPVYAGERCVAVLDYVVDEPGTGVTLGYIKEGKQMWLFMQPSERDDVHPMLSHEPGDDVSSQGSHRVEVLISTSDITKKQYDFIIYGWKPGEGNAKPTRVEIARQSLAIATFPQGWALAEVIAKDQQGDKSANGAVQYGWKKVDKQLDVTVGNGQPLTFTLQRIETPATNRPNVKPFEAVMTNTAVIEGIRPVLVDGKEEKLKVTRRLKVKKNPEDANVSTLPDLFFKIVGGNKEEKFYAQGDEFKDNAPSKEIPYPVGGSGKAFDIVITCTDNNDMGDNRWKPWVQRTITLRYRRLDGSEDVQPVEWTERGGGMVGGTPSGTREGGGGTGSGTGRTGDSGAGSGGEEVASGTGRGGSRPASVPPYIRESDCTKGRTPPPASGGTPTVAPPAGGGGVSPANPKPPVVQPPPPATPLDILKSPRPWEHPTVQRLMTEWLQTSEPNIGPTGPNDTRKWRWTEWGVAESPPSVKALHPDNGNMTREEYLFTLAGRLISKGNYSLREYLERRLRGENGLQPAGSKPASPIKEAQVNAVKPPGSGGGQQPPAPPAKVGTAVGNRAPELVATIVDPNETVDNPGPVFKLSEQKGKVIILTTFDAMDRYVKPESAKYIQELDRLHKAVSSEDLKTVSHHSGGMFATGDAMEMSEMFKVDHAILISSNSDQFEKTFAVPNDDLVMIIDQNGVIRYRADTKDGIFSPELRKTLKDVLPNVDWGKVFK